MGFKVKKGSAATGGMTFGKSFLASVAQEQDLYSLLGHAAIHDMFTPLEKPVFEYMALMARKHGKVPSPETILQETGVSLLNVPENPSFYLERMERRYTESTLKRSMLEAQKHFGDKDMNPEDAIPIMQEALTQITRMKFAENVVDYRQAGPLLMQHYADTMLGDDSGMLTGWKSYDDMSGGLRTGDMMSVIGRPMAGKSWLLIWIALMCWLSGRKVLLISMEMTALYVLQRISAVHSQVSMNHLKAGKQFGMTTLQKETYKEALEQAKDAESGLYVVDANLSGTVEDVWGLWQSLRPDVGLIDGGYLLKHPTVRDRYARVAENAELMKSELCPLGPLGVSWQFSRDAVKNKNKQAKKAEEKDATLEDIGYSDVIAQVSSTALGLMQMPSVESINTKRVKILKGRNGESGDFEINWDFNKMDFSEKSKDISELQFV